MRKLLNKIKINLEYHNLKKKENFYYKMKIYLILNIVKKNLKIEARKNKNILSL